MKLEDKNYELAVKTIKAAILQSQIEAAISINEKQLKLYYAIGKYISQNTRSGKWGEGAINSIGEKLERELPGLRGFSPRNLRYMRTFYEEWSFLENIPNNNLEPAGAKIDNRVFLFDFSFVKDFPIKEFLSIGFTMHRTILGKIKTIDERKYYIKRTFLEHYSRDELEYSIKRDDYHHQGMLPNNFDSTISDNKLAFKTLNSFKDSYFLDYLNTEEIDARDKEDIDERVLENGIVHNIKKFILMFGKDFAFIGNQYHLEAFGVDQYIDLLFFNRELNCLVAIELKKGDFKTSYLGQLSGYLSVLDKFERKEHENPPIGIILCKGMDRSFVDFVIQDFSKPMGVSTYQDLSSKVKECLPSIEDLQKLIDGDD